MPLEYKLINPQMENCSRNKRISSTLNNCLYICQGFRSLNHFGFQHLRSKSMVDWLSVAGSVSTIALALSPWLDLKAVVLSGNTGQRSIIPYAATLLNFVLGEYYGILLEDSVLIYLNMFNIAVASIYFLVFSYFHRDKNQVTVSIGALFAFITFLRFQMRNLLASEDFKELAPSVLGVICNAATIFMFTAPLSNLSIVRKARDSSMINAPMSIISMSCAISWFLYGLRAKDFFIVFPQIFGVLIASVQLYFKSLYPSKGSFVSSSTPPSQQKVHF